MSQACSYVVLGKPAGVNPGKRARAWGVKSDAQRDFAAVLAAYGQQARLRSGWRTTEHQVEVHLVIHFENLRPDLDGPVKPILDSLEVSRVHISRPGAGFLVNDRQVTRLIVERRTDKRHPRVEVTIRELSA